MSATMNVDHDRVKLKDQPRDVQRGVVRFLIREVMGSAFLAAILMLSAGRWDWLWGWVVVGITLLWSMATAAVTIPRNPTLLAERTGPRKGAKSWDTALMSVVGIMVLVRLVVAGLDERNMWSGDFALAAHLAAGLIAAAGYALVVWATASNAYFSQIVRIQEERGHSVQSGGPYGIVRHPGYLGTLLFELSVPVLLGSWWALIPGVITAMLMVVRTAKEDQTLQDELEGYVDYSRETRFRLIPGLW